jgi:hypothetical protein
LQWLEKVLKGICFGECQASYDSICERRLVMLVLQKMLFNLGSFFLKPMKTVSLKSSCCDYFRELTM